MPILREDSKDAAGIEQVKAVTITTYVKEGFTAESAIAAVRGQDITLLKHSGMVSVQLQPPGSAPPGAAPPAADAGPKAPALPPAERKFNPSEPRIPGGPHGGEWGGGAAGRALKDALKLGDRADLAPGEKLVGSDRISPSGGHDVDALFAVVDTPQGRRIRLGIIPTSDAEKWRAGNKGGTVNLTPESAGRLRDDLTQANNKAKKAAAKADADWEAGRTPDLAEVVAEGSIPSDWGDLKWDVYLTDDDPTSWTTSLAAGTDAGDSVLYPGDLRKLIGKLAGFAGSSSGQRAAGHDTTPGHDELHHYWVAGPGLAKWEHAPKPWTTLVALLTPHVGLERAKVYASRWFIERKGYSAGSDINRVVHGKPPRGDKVGPG
jgi:hypothetical protein